METVLEYPIDWDWNASDSSVRKTQFLENIIGITQDETFNLLLTAKTMPKDLFMSAVARLVEAYGFIVNHNASVFSVYQYSSATQYNDKPHHHKPDEWEHYIDDLHRDVDDYDG